MGRGSVVTSELGLEVLNWAQNEGGGIVSKSRGSEQVVRRDRKICRRAHRLDAFYCRR